MPDPTGSAADAGVAPIAPTEREPVLDVLRGFAMLGILLINVEYMRSSGFYGSFLGEVASATQADRVIQFATGWLAAGKFLSSFAILFGIGAALMMTRAQRAGPSPRRLLARRYAILMAFGVAHMLLLFPGDILFLYGLTGMVLLAFAQVGARTALRWAAGLLAATTLLFTGLTAATAFAPEPAADDPAVAAMTEFFASQRAQAVAAHTEGSYLDVVRANLVEAAVMQGGQLFVLPWVLALFLVGVAIVRAGVLHDLAEHRRLLRRIMMIGLGVGLPANLVMGALGPMWGGATLQPGAGTPGLLIAAAVVQQVGAPLLAAGYLSAVALVALRFGSPRRLAAIGRMALTAYLLQSLLALVVFTGFGLYDRLGSAQSMLVVVGIWAVLFVVCPAWMDRFRFGPVEWLWRSLTYRSLQPMRAA